MAFAQLPSYPCFDCKSEGVSIRWSKWISRLSKNLFVAYNITDEDRKKALLLTYGGDELCDIVEAMLPADTEPEEGESPFDKLVSALNNHFNPKVNKEIQRYTFRQTRQVTDSIDDFFSTLKQLAPSCDFNNSDEEIRSQLITGCKSPRVREKGLTSPSLSLYDLLQFARTTEITQSHAKSFNMDQLTASTNRLSLKPQSSRKHRQSPQVYAPNSTCRNCGKEWPHKGGQGNCPAHNKICSNCGRLNHFSSVCRSKHKSQSYKQTSRGSSFSSRSKPIRNKSRHHVRNVDKNSDQQSSDEDYIYMSSNKMTDKNMPIFDIQIQNCKIKVLADSGASINIINKKDFDSIVPKPKLSSCKAKIYPFSQLEPLSVIGKFIASVTLGKITKDVEFMLMDTNDISIIGWKSSQNLGMIQQINALNPDQSIDNLTDRFKDLFNGVGKLTDCSVKLHINQDVPPVAQRYRRIPFHMRKHLEDYLHKQEELDILEKASGPTPWVSPVVIVPKPKSPDKIRICIDMRAPNKAIQRERHNVPTLDELTATLSGAACFSKLDLNQGYNQIELDTESRYITTFATHKGLYRYKRLSFGINSASEIFQEKIRQALNGLCGTINVSDDILVFGKTQAEHDQNLEKVFFRLREKNLTLNKDKCQYRKTSIEFLGHTFSANGMKPSPGKIKNIIDMPAPKSTSEVRSLLGMLNFCGSRFIPDYATITYELRKLTQKKTPFSWNEKHDQALTEIKRRLQATTNLVYFDSNKDIQIYVDASPVGISGILTQLDDNKDTQIVQFASRALSETEQRYSQTEREALAVTWSCEHFHIYLYGAPSFTMFTDHKPLVTLFGNPKTKLPSRIERWVMKTQSYAMNIVYKPGKDNPADYLSRHPTNKPLEKEQKLAEEYIRYIIDNTIPKAMTLDDVKQETLSDVTLQAVIKSLGDNRWHEHIQSVPKTDIQTFMILKQCQNELSVTKDGIILKSNKIVLPRTLQKQAVNLAHSGHQGQNKTLSLLREKSWFQGMRQAVDEVVRNCFSCQIATPAAQREPLRMSNLPDKPWSELSADFGHLPNGEQVLVVMDEYSRYVLVEIMKHTSARAVIPKLDKIFAEFGIPDQLKTDNGPPFNSYEFDAYLKHMGVRHRKITPLWPRANGETERFMKTLKKSIKAALAQKRNWRQEMYRFLLAYRSTPHCSIGVPPAQLIFGHNLKTKLPEPHVQNSPTSDLILRQKDAYAKSKMKAYADKKQYVKPSELKIGDPVLVKDTTCIKPITPYEPKPYIVTKKNGSMITASRDSKEITRNSSFFKGSPRPPTDKETEEDKESDETSQPGCESTPSVLESMESHQKTQHSPGRPRRRQKMPSRFNDYVMI